MNFISLFKILLTISIYSFSVKAIDGSSIMLSSFKGKKILIANTASGSKYARQFTSLERLREQHHDSLVVLAFPCNDFGNEPGNDSLVNSSLRANYPIGYILCSKVSVYSPLFQWLGDGTQNGAISNPVNEDFFKYLIDESGNLRGVFAGSVDPMDSVLQNAINTNYNQ